LNYYINKSTKILPTFSVDTYLTLSFLMIIVGTYCGYILYIFIYFLFQLDTIIKQKQNVVYK